MAEARGETVTLKSSKQPQNPTLELALREVGLASRVETSVQPPVTTVPQPNPKAVSNPAKSQSIPKSQLHAPKHKRLVDEKALADIQKRKERAEKKRRDRKAAAAAATERRRAEARAREVKGKNRREEERTQRVRTFIAEIKHASFADLIAAWRSHIEFIRYNRLTGRNQLRTALYEELVAAIESEWQRRSRLRLSEEGYFDWPSTEAKRGNGEMAVENWASEGVLGYLGYHVGNNSKLLREQRHAILRRAFSMHLPPIESPAYMINWGSPSSADRLRKMANSLASFARQAKRRITFDMSEAIDAWETDLSMLHDEFYVGKFGFGWPAV